MIATGLLWYDDDPRRPLAQKLADASERYRERIGFEPTTCQLNPVLIPAPAVAVAGGSPRRTRPRPRIAEPAIAVRLVPNQHLRPNYFFIGIEDGERARRVPGWRGETLDDDDHDRASRPLRKPSTLTKPAKHTNAAKTAASTKPTKVAELATASAPLAAHGAAPAGRRGVRRTPGDVTGAKRAAVGALPAAPITAGPGVRFHLPAESATGTTSAPAAKNPTTATKPAHAAKSATVSTPISAHGEGSGVRF
ncbi:MAG: hypothetical protein ACRDHP_16440, partial [Ktedonobacterales bacterium]